jgi:hypothetical protein
MLAAAGVVRHAAHADIGGVSLTLDVREGSIECRNISVRSISPEDHPQAREIAAGDEIALAGLRRLGAADEYSLPIWGSMAIWATA